MTKTRLIFISLLLAPLIPLSNLFTLGGQAPDPKRLPLTAAHLYSGAYQNYFEAYFARHFGAFRPLVRLDARLDSAIGESKFNDGSCGLRGRNDVLIPLDEVDFLNQVTFDDASIARHVDQMIRAQRTLKKHGVPMKVIFIPPKLSYFPNHLPPRWRIERPGTPEASERRVARALEQFRARGLDFIDARQLIERVMTMTGRPAFPHGGRHFTDFTSCQMLGALLPEPKVCPLGEERAARQAEDDLRRCLNETSLRAPERLMDTSLTTLASPYKKALLVGSSFMRELENEARRLSTFEDLHLFYYNKNDYVGERVRPIPEGEAWRDFVLSRDLIVVDFFAAQIEQMGYGFTDRVNREL